jgi:hypothetical protein
VTGPRQSLHRALVYEFEVAGREYRGMTQFFGPEVQMCGGGEPVAILYDPSDSELNTAIYEAKKSSLPGTGQLETKHLSRAKRKNLGTDLPN